MAGGDGQPLTFDRHAHRTLERPRQLRQCLPVSRAEQDDFTRLIGTYDQRTVQAREQFIKLRRTGAGERRFGWVHGCLGAEAPG